MSNQAEAVRDALECPCCSQTLKSPLLFASCGHAFCSVCIKRWLLVHSTCPVCNAAQSETELVPCVTLQKAVEALAGAAAPSAAKSVDSSSKRHKAEDPSSEKASKLPVVVYHVINDDALNNLLRTHGLPTSGSRDSRINLHREFTLAYNAEIDAGEIVVDVAKVRKQVLQTRNQQAAAMFFSKAKTKASESGSQIKLQKQLQAFRRERRIARAQERSKWRGQRVESHWRAVFSDLLNQPIYYNALTKECTTQRPPELEAERLSENAEAESDDDVVVVVAD